MTLTFVVTVEFADDARDHTSPSNPVPVTEVVQEWAVNCASDMQSFAHRWFNGSVPGFSDLRPAAKCAVGHTIMETYSS